MTIYRFIAGIVLPRLLKFRTTTNHYWTTMAFTDYELELFKMRSGGMQSNTKTEMKNLISLLVEISLNQYAVFSFR